MQDKNNDYWTSVVTPITFLGNQEHLFIYEKFASVSGMVNGGFPAIFSYLSLYLAVFLFFLPIIRDW